MATAHRVDQVMTGIPSAQHAGLPKPDHKAYVAPEPKAAAPMIMGALPSAAIESVFRPMPNQDSSALDRAKGFAIRFAVFGVLIVCMALFILLAFHWASSQLGTHPEWYVYLMVFLLCMVVLGYKAFQELNELDYEHTSTGVEHHRLDVAENSYLQTLDAELQMRSAMLGVTLRLSGGEDERARLGTDANGSRRARPRERQLTGGQR